MMIGLFQKKEHSSLDMVRSHMTETILNLTLEIIYLLTGEDYILVKTFGQLVTPSNRPRVVDGWSRIQNPMMEPPPPSLTLESNKDKKILEVTQKIIELLTGEVPIRCQDVTIYFSMEEWEYLEGHKDLYKDVMMEKRPPLTSPDGSSNKNPPEKCPRPFWESTQEHHKIPPTHLLHSQDSTLEHWKNSQEHDEIHQAYFLSSCDSKQEHKEIPQKDHGIPHTRHLYSQDSTQKHHKNTQKHHKISTSLPLSSQDSTEEHHEIPQAHSLYSWDSTQHHKVPQEHHEIPQAHPLYSRDSTEKQHNIPQNSLLCSQNSTHKHNEILQAHHLYSGDFTQQHKIPQSCPNYYLNSTGKHHEIPQDDCNFTQNYQDEDLIIIKVEEDKPEDKLSQEEEIPPEISIDDPTLGYKHHVFSPDGKVDEDINIDENRIDLPADFQQILHSPDLFFSPDGYHSAFIGGPNLISQGRTHNGKKRYSCSECGKCFAQKSGLGRHKRNHRGRYDYTCSHCGKSFTQKAYLVVHERIHTNEKPFSCAVCGKCFNQKPNLLIHERIHSDVKPYTCSACGKCFKYKSSFTLHERLHTGDKPFSCPLCGKRFSKKSSLVSHERRHIGQKPLL